MKPCWRSSSWPAADSGRSTPDAPKSGSTPAVPSTPSTAVAPYAKTMPGGMPRHGALKPRLVRTRKQPGAKAGSGVSRNDGSERPVSAASGLSTDLTAVYCRVVTGSVSEYVPLPVRTLVRLRCWSAVRCRLHLCWFPDRHPRIEQSAPYSLRCGESAVCFGRIGSWGGREQYRRLELHRLVAKPADVCDENLAAAFGLFGVGAVDHAAQDLP